MNKDMQLFRKALIFICISFFASNKCYNQSFYIDLGYGISNHKFSTFNNQYINYFAKPNNILNKNINFGQTLCMNINYCYKDNFTLGISYAYISSLLKDNTEYVHYDTNGMPCYYYGKSFININSSLIGLNTAISLKNIFINENNNSFIKKFNLFLWINLSYGFSKLRLDFYMPNDSLYEFSSSSTSFLYKGHGLSIFPLLKLHYKITNDINFGLSGGYRYFNVKRLKDINKNDYIINNQRINLDFNGMSLMIFFIFKI